MIRSLTRLLAMTSLAIACLPFAQGNPLLAKSLQESSEPIQFNRDVRPILADKCLACHGADPKSREADLRLDDPTSTFGPRSDGPAIVPGNLAESQVWQRITAEDPSLMMPPSEFPKPLTDREKNILQRWIEQGASFEKHWSFEAPRPITPPVGPSSAQIRNPIDAFIQAKLPGHRNRPAPIAPPPILIRRVAFALTGLPPTLEEQQRYFDDPSPKAYEAMVDSYLASDRFGEEMARHWLDVARYADTHGMHLDNERQTWAYRDWVIQAFNRNLPFDQFTIEQLAGDLLPNPTPDQLIATGFNRCNVTSSEGGSIDAELLYRYAVDRASTTMEAWMGLTGGCAVCHDHKFDPISQKEFYSFYAFFNAAADPAMDGNALLTQPILKLESAETRQRLQQLDESIRLKTQESETQAEQLTYVEPSSESTSIEWVWMDDAFPSGTLRPVGATSQFVETTSEKPAFSGSRYLRRQETGLGQDVWENPLTPKIVPDDARFRIAVRIDPSHPPQAIMVQFFRDGWNHRAVWGNRDIIPWGKPDSFEKVHMGELPAPNQWVTLEFPLEQLGLSAGDTITGFALTQHAGNVDWDGALVKGRYSQSRDPLESFTAWMAYAKQRQPAALPEPIRQALQSESPNEETMRLLRRFYLLEICAATSPAFAAQQKEIQTLKEEKKQVEDSMPGTFIYRDLEKPRPSFVMMRGSYDKPGDAVEPNVPGIFPPVRRESIDRPLNRLDLARWLISDDHPLTSRVAVNRLWQQFFGTGLVKTSYDFGTQGELPTHPELLDWLAQYYRESGWDTKAFVRLLVTSHTFMQDSKVDPELHALDPENRWLARGPRFRLDAEPLRDNVLFVSSLIDLTMGGKGVRTYQPPNIWEPVGFAGSNTRNYEQEHGSALYRRSIYTFFKRTAPAPFLANFDAPNREQFCSRRERSNTPLQALQLMNDVQHIEAARMLATRLIREGGPDLKTRLHLAYRLVLCRLPSDHELPILVRQFESQFQRFSIHPDHAKDLLKQGERLADPQLDPVELASLTMVCNTLLNLDETLCRN